jgi:formylglycine-generating enzyme required for sulfatase activity
MRIALSFGMLACFSSAALAIEMVAVPAGSFQMGYAGLSEPVHTVTLTHDFAMSRTEITNEEFLPVLQWAYDNGLASVSGDWVQGSGQNLLRLSLAPYDFAEIRFNSNMGLFYLTDGTGTYQGWGPVGGYDPGPRPANQMTWYGAAVFCDWLSLMEGLPAYYDGNWNSDGIHNPYLATGYRLPTEAEWEYAASFPDDRPYPWGFAAPACHRANIRPSGYCVGWTVDVGSYPEGTSALGFEDLAGNVYEWVNDWYSAYPTVAITNPYGAGTGTLKQIRGGSWAARIEWDQMNTGYRRSEPPTATTGSPWFAGGFCVRIARTLPAHTSGTVDLPSDFAWLDARPNPFNPSTTLRFRLDHTRRMRIQLHDARGALVQTLAEGLFASGYNELHLEAGNHGSGLYLVTLTDLENGRSLSQKLMLLK